MQTRREYTGPAFLSGAFRPFFLAASVWAVVSIFVWVLIISGVGNFPSALVETSWHSHEMIFGFGGAALAGFILTAVPNWTGRLPVRGMPLAVLAGLWLLGRLSILAAAFLNIQWIGLFDLPFLFALSFAVFREILSAKNKRNVPVAGLFGVFALANLIFHLEGFGVSGFDGHGWRLGLGATVVLIAVIGGRIVPSFTRNWLAKSAPRGGAKPRLPVTPNALDKYIVILTGIALSAWTIAPEFIGSGLALILAGAGQLLRVSRWRGLSTLKSSIVFILHIGYAWIGLGLALLGTSIIWGGLISSNAIHALTIGAVGTMIAAVMSRASLGHAGRKIKAGLGLSSVYILISIAVCLRLATAPFPELYSVWIMASGSAWMLAFAIFAALFFPLYLKPR